MRRRPAKYFDMAEAAKRLGVTRSAIHLAIGEKGYAAFIRLWSKEAHLEFYYGFLRKIAEAKLSHVPWKGQNGREPAAADRR